MRLLLLLIVIFSSIYLNAQIAGESPPELKPDTLFIYESPHQLIDYDRLSGNINTAIGLEVLISTSGFGGGAFFHKYLSKNMLLFSEFFISGARKADEFDQWIPLEGYWRILNKINRLYRIPTTFGIKKFLFTESLQNSFKPYIALGAGPAFIFAVPYSPNRDPIAKPENFFSALDKTDIYIRPNIAASFGAYITTTNTAMIGVNFKYYYIPFGKDGLESIKNLPITDFGGVILSISIGKLN